MQSEYTSEIETVLVTAHGRTLDCVSFPSRHQANSYKDSVRRWAIQRGIVVTVQSQHMQIVNKDRLPLRAPLLARAS